MTTKNKHVNKKLVQDKYKRDYKKFNGWQHAIEAAEFQLLRAQVAEREMKAVIAVFTEKMKAGEPWPWKDAGVEEESVSA